MAYLSEFIGCLIFIGGGYAYMCNISLKSTLVGKLNFVELCWAWSLAVGFGLTIAVMMGGPGFLNPGVVFGNMIFGGLSAIEGVKYLLIEFAAAGVAVGLNVIFFWDSFKDSENMSKRGIFAAYPVKMNLPLNFLQEVIATFLFLLLVFMGIAGVSDLTLGNQSVIVGVVGFAAVFILALTFNSTGFSMNAMRSVFSSFWYSVFYIPGGKDRVDWKYQIIVNFFGSSIGAILAVAATSAIKSGLMK